jgi:hypothetical protein
VLFLFIIAYHATVETDIKFLHKIVHSKWYRSRFHKDLSVPFLSSYHDQELTSNAVTTTEVQLLSADSNLEQATEPEADDMIAKEREDIALLF